MKSPPAGIGDWVNGGTPSMSLTIARPCQWMLVSAGSLFDTAARSVSPLRIRISLPGTRPLYAHVRTATPPRSISVSAGSNFSSTTGSVDGVTVAVLVFGEEQAATPAAAARSMNCRLSSIAKAWHLGVSRG